MKRKQNGQFRKKNKLRGRLFAILAIAGVIFLGMYWYSQQLDQHLSETTYCFDMDGNHYECE